MQDVPVVPGLAAPPAPPGTSHGTAVLHPLAAVTPVNMALSTGAEVTGFLAAREARWNCRAGSSGCLAGCKGCDYGDGSLLPFVPFSYGVRTASPVSVMEMGDSGVLNRENPARFTEQQQLQSPRRIFGLVGLLMKCCTASSGMNTSRVPPSPLYGHFIRTAEVNKQR